MWSLTLPREKRISGPRNFRSSAKEDFFNNIGTKRTSSNVRGQVANGGKADMTIPQSDFRN